MLSTSLLYRGLSAPQQPQTPDRKDRGKQEGQRWFIRHAQHNLDEGNTTMASLLVPFQQAHNLPVMCLFVQMKK